VPWTSAPCAALLAAACLALAAGGQDADEPPEDPTDIVYRADRVGYDAKARTVHLDGRVVIERAGGRLRAARGVLDRAAGTLRLEGGVLGVQGRQVLVADAAVIDLRARAADLTSATVFLKDRSAGLASLADPSAARTQGRNTLVLQGRAVRRLDDGGFVATGVSFTPCDCPGTPDYELLSPEVRVFAERAELRDPSLRVLGARLPLILGLSVPLTDRQSGLLAPRFGFAVTTGFGFAQPLFLTLGPSWDLTISPGWFTGAAAALNPDLRPAIGYRTVRGPRADLELRAAPAEGVSGRLSLEMLHDLDQGARGRGFGGFRGVARLSQRALTRAGVLAIEGVSATDAMAIADAQPGVFERALDALRTDASFVSAAGPLSAGVQVTLLQDVRVANASAPDRRLWGADAMRTFQRLPAAFAQVAPVQVAGPIAFAAEASVARFMALRRADERESSTGFGPTDLGAGAAAPLAIDAARAAALRFDASPRLIASVARGAGGAVSAGLGARGDAWLFDGAPGRNRQRLQGRADLRAETELARKYGSWLHSVVPSLELRVLTSALDAGGDPVGDPADAGGPAFLADAAGAEQGLAPGQPLRSGLTPRDDPARLATQGVPAVRRPYDEIDGAAPRGGVVQAVARIDQAIWIPGSAGGAPRRVAEVSLAQDVILAGAGGARAAETIGAASLHIGGLSASARAQFDWALGKFTGLAASARLADARGDDVHASAFALRAAASELIRGGIDELFSSVRLAREPGGLLGVARVGAVARLPMERPPVSLAWDLDVTLGDLLPGLPDKVHRLSASIDTPCRCAGVQLAVDLPFAGGALRPPSVRFLLDLKSLGSIGTP